MKMPQLDTAPWLMVIIGTLLSLFILFQLKLKEFSNYTMPMTHDSNTLKVLSPWETKWTKIYLPLSLSPHS